jgi:hypothetical protein
MPSKPKWRLQPNGDGVPISVFDKPDDSKRPEDDNVSKSSLLNPFVVNSIAVVVTLIWSLSFLADIVIKDYQPPASIHIAFMFILGGIFGFQIVNGKEK